MEKEKNTCPICKSKHREGEELTMLKNRLKRIEGQIRGVIGMLEADAYCVDILTQTAAISSAVSSFNKELLKNHIKSCVIEDKKGDNMESVDELVGILHKLMK